MPIALDPLQAIWLTLDSDRKADEGDRPAFQCRFPTCRQVLQIEELIKAAREAKRDQAKAVALLKQALGLVIVGHRNIPGDFSADRLDELLTPRELWQLAYQTVTETQLKEHELGESGRPVQSGPVPSAAPAPADPA